MAETDRTPLLIVVSTQSTTTNSGQARRHPQPRRYRKESRGPSTSALRAPHTPEAPITPEGYPLFFSGRDSTGAATPSGT